MPRRRTCDRWLFKGATLIIVIGLTVPLAGCLELEEPSPSRITILLASPFMDSRRPDSETVWDATMDISKKTPVDEDVAWTSLTVEIKGLDGSVILSETPLSKDSGMYGSAVEVWYVDESGGRNTADVGDAVKVTSMDQSYQGASVLLYHREGRVADATLPFVFP